MAFKASLLFMFACFLLVTNKVASAETTIAAAYPPKVPEAHSPCPSPEKVPPVHTPSPAPPAHAQAPAHYIPPPPEAQLVPPHGCVPDCEERCRDHRKKRPCMRVCTKCCAKCKCVPLGKDDNNCKNWDYVFMHGVKYQCP